MLGVVMTMSGMHGRGGSEDCGVVSGLLHGLNTD